MLQKGERLITYRSAVPAAPKLPLRVRSVGCYSVTDEWYERPRKKWFVQLFWGMSGEGELQLHEEAVKLRPGTIFLYAPGDTHQIRVLTKEWAYCWFTLDHPDALRWVEAFGLGPGLGSAGTCPEALFLEMSDALLACTIEGEHRAAHLAHAILLKAAATIKQVEPGSLSAGIKSRIDACFAEPDFCVAALAESLKIHRSTLFRHFRSTFGLMPSTYLHNLRVQRGLSLLRESAEPIQEVSRRAGFVDPNYFSRAVRKATGLSPREFRKT